jgi:hypothetical protein
MTIPTISIIAGHEYVIYNNCGYALIVQGQGQSSPPALANGKTGKYILNATKVLKIYEEL